MHDAGMDSRGETGGRQKRTFPSAVRFKVMGPGENMINRFSGRSIQSPAAFSSVVYLFEAKMNIEIRDPTYQPRERSRKFSSA